MKYWIQLSTLAAALVLATGVANAQPGDPAAPATTPPLPTVLGGISQQEPVTATPGPGAVIPQGSVGTQAPTPLAQGGLGAGGQEYVLGPEDVVEIAVVGTSERMRARIYTDGSIQLNLIGRVSAAGKTPLQLAAEVQKALKAGGYYSDPVVTVEVAGYASRYVTVLGAFGSPGLVPINRPYRLTDILARVGGVRDTAADYVIVRSESGQERRYEVSKLSSGAIEDPTINAGDKIFSPTAEQIFVNGQVNSPGAFPLKTGMTIAQAIATAGGLTESGTDKRVKVRRGAENLKLKPTDTVQAGDVLTISERLF